MANGYIYIRFHESYDIACKLGKTHNIPDRDTQYATGELKRGYFQVVFEVANAGIIERLLQNEFRDLHIKYNAGTEFYDKKITDDIEPYLVKHAIKYKRLSPGEVSDLLRINRVRDTVKKVKNAIKLIKSTRLLNRTNRVYKPRSYQCIIIEKSVQHFEQNDRGILVLMCGVGKTLIALWITKALNVNSILIGVPNLLLLKQWKQTVGDLFGDIKILVVSSGVTVTEIVEFLQNNKTNVVITTYASVHKVYEATQQTQTVFNMKINDECQHLTNIIKADTKQYIQMLDIPADKQLSLTATLKNLECTIAEVVSNDNTEYFGTIIDRKCLLWAINENVVCDYVIQTVITSDADLEHPFSRLLDENDKRLFLSAFVALKSISDGHSHHLLIYSNTRENSSKLITYLKILLNDEYFMLNDLYCSVYHGDMSPCDQERVIDNFRNAKYGIITCVYCLGEGWDFPLLDAVVFSESMSSSIRIIQAALRPGRKNPLEVAKRTKIILPILNTSDWLENNNNNDLKKVRQVIYEMGLEDTTIMQKIKVYRIHTCREVSKKSQGDTVDEIGEYDEELTQRVLLKTVKRTALTTTYEKAVKIIADKNIKTKLAYYELCEKDARLSPDPEIVFKSQFTSWIEYLSIQRVYYDLETCKNRVSILLTQWPEIKKDYLDVSLVTERLCNLDPLFPPNGLWVEYYNVKTLAEIISFTFKKKSPGVALD